MARVLLALVAVGLTIYAVLDIGRTPRAEVRVMPKLLWFVAALVPVLGPVAWLTLGRPARPKGGQAKPATPGLPFGGGRKRGPVAPDDDPEFLRRLGDEAWSRKMEEKRRSQTDPTPGTPPATPDDAGDSISGDSIPGDSVAGDSTAGDGAPGPDDPGRSPA